MNHAYHDSIKPFLCEQMTQCAKEQNLTQEKAAELLEIDTRSYAYLQAGLYMCSTTTLLLFLIRICPDPLKFLKDAKKIFDKADNKPLLHS